MDEQGMIDQLVGKLNDLYISYRKRYVLSLPGCSMFTPKRKDGMYSALTDGVVRNHQEHKYAVAIYAGPNASKFLCFDVDDGNPESVRSIIRCLENMGISRDVVYVSYSGSKGYHVELFFDEMIYTNVLRGLYEMVIDQTALDCRKVEFRPTSGNAIKLPLSLHAKTKNICWFVDRDTLQPIERMDYLLEVKQLSAAQIKSIVPLDYQSKSLPPRHISSKRSSTTSISSDSLEVCGTRHNHMRSIAVYMRQTGNTRSQCHKALQTWYSKQDQSLIHSEPETVYADIESILDWVFSGKFKLSPQSTHRRIWLTASDAKLVLSAANRSQRRILFLLLVCSSLGEKAISLADISRIVGVSRKTTSECIKKLRELGKIVICPGGKHLTPEGQYVSLRNQYNIPRGMSRRKEKKLPFDLASVENEFDTNYRRFLSMLDVSELSDSLSSVEMKEYHSIPLPGEHTNAFCIDTVAGAHHLYHEIYGAMTIYVYEGERLYPLVDVLRCLGIKNLDDAVHKHSEKQIWYTLIGTRKVKKSFVNEEDLHQLLKRSRSIHKEALISWLIGRN